MKIWIQIWNFNIILGDVSLFSILIDVLDIPIIWKDQLKAKFWNDKNFKILLDELTVKKKVNNKLFQKISNLDSDTAEIFVRDTIGLLENQSPVGRSLKEITQRLIKKSQEIKTDPLSKPTVKLIKEFLSISDKPLQALKKLRSISKNIDSRLNSQIDSMSERIEMMLDLKVDIKNSILSVEKGRMVEYYTGFLFDFNSSDLRNDLNIAGGGRYDDLINSVSDENNIPAVGAAINLDRLEKIISSEKFKWAQYC